MEPTSSPSLREAAAQWVVRQDRGFSPVEAAEFERWLAAAPERAEALERARTVWAALDAIPTSAARPAAPATGKLLFWPAWAGLAAAAAVAGLLLARPWGRHPDSRRAASAAVAVLEEARVLALPDGTIVRLNTGAELAEQFTPAERRVRLIRGEAHFTVAKNPLRPFVVRAGTVEVRAVGTAFNVNLESTAVEVLVTEGRVRVDASADHSAAPAAGAPILHAGQRAVVALGSASAVAVSNLNGGEVRRALAWQEPLLRLGGDTLANLAVEFELRTGVRLLVDPELARMRIGGRFRADDLDGFVHLLEANYGVTAERRTDGAVLLRRGR